VTSLWARIPLWLLVDGGVRSLPPAAQLALVHIAATDGFTRCGDTAADVRGALDALAAGAGAALPDMIGKGIVEHTDGVLRLVPPSDVAAEAPPEAGEEQPQGSDAAPPSTPTRGPRRPPSHSPEAQRRRKVLSWFNHRAGPCRDVPKAATWEQWSASPEGVALLAVGRPRHAGNNPGNKSRGVVPASGNNPGTTQEQPGNNPPSDSPSDEETTKKEAKNAVGARAREQGNKAAGTREQVVPGVVPAGHLPPTVGGFTIGNAEEVLHTIRSRSDGRFSTRAAHPQLQRFHALCCDLMDRGATRAEFERIGDHIRHGGMNWAKRPDVGALIAEGKDQRGPQLPRILTDIDGCAECGGASADAVGGDEVDALWAAAATKAGYKL
jgi:hypothetical protein